MGACDFINLLFILISHCDYITVKTIAKKEINQDGRVGGRGSHDVFICHEYIKNIFACGTIFIEN